MASILSWPQCVNSSAVETGIFQKHAVNIMAADALAPSVTRSLAAMLTMYYKQVLIFHEDIFNHLALAWCVEMIENGTTCISMD